MFVYAVSCNGGYTTAIYAHHFWAVLLYIYSPNILHTDLVGLAALIAVGVLLSS